MIPVSPMREPTRAWLNVSKTRLLNPSPEGLSHLKAWRSPAVARTLRRSLGRTPSRSRSGGAPCSAPTLALRQSDLHHWLAPPEKFDRIWECAGKDSPEAGVRHVPAPEPQDLRRCAEPAYEIDEILVLREHDHLRFASPIEDLRVFRLSQTQIANVHCVQGELPANQWTKLRRDVRIHPENHGTTTAWLTRLLANRKHA
jgi:hypothetical protein